MPSPLIGKPAPQFALPQLDDAGKTLAPRRHARARSGCSTSGPRGASPAARSIRSWSSSRRSSVVPIYGLNYKDTARGRAAPGWRASATPTTLSLFDADGRVGIDYGVYGVPETFVIDRQRRDPLQAHRPGHARGAREQDRAAAEEARRLMKACASSLALLPRSRRRSLLAKEAAPEAADPALEARMVKHHRRSCAAWSARTRRIADSNAVARGRPAPRDRASRSRRARATREIVDYMTARYGDFVLYRPPLRATTLLLWFGPALMLAGRRRGARRRPAPAQPHGRRRLRCRRRDRRRARRRRRRPRLGERRHAAVRPDRGGARSPRRRARAAARS